MLMQMFIAVKQELKKGSDIDGWGRYELPKATGALWTFYMLPQQTYLRNVPEGFKNFIGSMSFVVFYCL